VIAELAASGKTRFTVGVLADTHMPYRMKQLPRAVFRAFDEADLILHAGDVDQIDCLQELASLAPLFAVRGNLHFTDLSHGGWYGLRSLAGDWFMEKLLEPGRKRANQRVARRLLTMYPQTDVIVFGHTHKPYQVRQGSTLLFNPGAVCRSRNWTEVLLVPR
jgi:putative phosphoesterase